MKDVEREREERNTSSQEVLFVCDSDRGESRDRGTKQRENYSRKRERERERERERGGGSRRCLELRREESILTCSFMHVIMQKFYFFFELSFLLDPVLYFHYTNTGRVRWSSVGTVEILEN